MDRETAWSDRELADLARVFIQTSQDAIVGTDQTASEFSTKLFENFCKLAPPDADPKWYKFYEARLTHAKWKSVLRKINSFSAALTQVKALRLTGSHTDDNLLSICIARLLKKRNTISADAKDYPHSRWALHFAFKFFRTISKSFCDVNNTATAAALSLPENDD